MSDSPRTYLAADLGASSGRVLAGLFDGRRITLQEAYRFANGGVLANDRLYWDLLGLWRELQTGLRAAADQHGGQVASVGVDTWGVDFGLLGSDGNLLASPLHYRDRHTEGILDEAFQVVSREEIFAETGLQFMPFNSLFQLIAMQRDASPALEAAQQLLMIPDLFHWLLTGQRSVEQTNASTTQLLNPRTGAWSDTLLQRFGLPASIFGPTLPPGANLGPLRGRVAAETGLGAEVQVVLPGTHDTASAVMAVPTNDEVNDQPQSCYISSGTWSLMGVEVASAVINDRCRDLNFTNEGGVGGSFRLLKNIAGLWLVQECRRIWSREDGRELDWGELMQAAQQSPPLQHLIDPDDPRLVAPADMPQAIRSCAAELGQPAPEQRGAVVRCALESLALRYRMVLGWLEELTGGRLTTIHVVGGGTQNELLCQMTADACGCRVVAGPAEATAIGNVMMQAVAAGDVGSISEAREVIRNSFDLKPYEPRDTAMWDDAFGRFQQRAR